MDDGNEGNQHVQLAFGRAVGHILSFSVAQTIEEDMETAAASERGGAAGRGGVDSSMGGSGGSNVGSGEGSGGKKDSSGSSGSGTTKSSDVSRSSKSRAGFRLKFGSSKKEATRFTVSSALSYLRTHFTKAATLRRGSMGACTP